MKKIMFSDKYGLTKAVVERRKTQTRRVIPHLEMIKINLFQEEYYELIFDKLEGVELINHYYFVEKRGRLPYQIGEVVAVAQSYCAIAEELENCNNATCAAHYEKNVQKASEYISLMEHPGFNNKLFVAADMIIHRIRITYVRVERLQDISDADCIKEGIQTFYYGDCKFPPDGYTFDDGKSHFNSPREAFAHLINKVSKKDVWNENPYVFVYDFELVK